MILKASDGVRGRIVDLDTGEDLKRVSWINLDTGHFEVYQTNPDGSLKQDAAGNYLTIRGIGRFKFLPAERKPADPLLGADKCSLCSSPLTLPGDDLCVVCRASQEPAKQARATRDLFTRSERMTTLDLTLRCSAYGCSRVACWAVADEAPASFVKGRLFGKVAYFARGMTVGRRHYCDHHYRPPRLLDARGEVVSEVELRNDPR